jgi:hypothetical protein
VANHVRQQRERDHKCGEDQQRPEQVLKQVGQRPRQPNQLCASSTRRVSHGWAGSEGRNARTEAPTFQGHILVRAIQYRRKSKRVVIFVCLAVIGIVICEATHSTH